jgi:hypothetical protein
VSFHHVDWHNDWKMTTQKHGDEARNTLTMKDVELSFFFLFLQAVGLELEHILFEDGDTTNKSSSWREREQRQRRNTVTKQETP